MFDDSMHIVAAGITLTTSGTATSGTIPNTISGIKPNYIRIQVTQYAYVKIGSAGVTATTNDILISPNKAEVFTVAGATTISVLQHTSAGSVNIVPLENV